MKAKMKCSSCGAELDNLSMSWGKKQWLYIVPIMLLGFFPLFKMTMFKGDPSKEMSISEIRKQTDGSTIEIIGLITNNGSHDWTSTTVEVEFFDSPVFFDRITHAAQKVFGLNDFFFEFYFRGEHVGILQDLVGHAQFFRNVGELVRFERFAGTLEVIEHPAPLRIANPFFDYLVKPCKHPASPKEVAAIHYSMVNQPYINL